MAETSQVEMDILTLGLAMGAPAEQQTAPLPGEPGFAEALEQVQTDGLCPSLGPPGPEPPPDILLAEEGVEGIEPNALPEQPDFLPLPKVETDIDLPQPFWEEASATTQDEATPQTDSQPVEEAMEWLAGQMLGGFFAAPVAVVAEPAPLEAPVAQTPVAPISVPFSTQVAPEAYVVKPEIAPEQAVAPEKKLDQAPVQQAPTEFETVLTEATGEEAPKVLETLKPMPVPTPEVEQVEDGFIDTPAAVQTVSESQALTVEENPLPSTDPLLQKKNPDVQIKAVAQDPTKVETREPGLTSVAEKDPKIVPAPEKGEGKASVKVSTETGEPTTLEVTAAKPEADTKNQNQGGNGNTDLRYAGGKKEGRETKVEVELAGMPEVESTGFTKVEGTTYELNATAPVQKAVVIDAKPESLKPAEVDAVVTQLTDRLHMLAAARPRNGVTIHLNPDELGSITVMVKSIGRQVETQLFASDDRVREALDQNRTRLVDAMDARGFNLHTVTVSQQSGHSTQQDSPRGWQSAQQHNQNPSDHPQGHTGQGGRSFGQPKAENAKGWVSKQEGVDLSI